MIPQDDLEREVERLLIKEAALINQNRFEEWLTMYTEDSIYWIPTSDERQDPRKYVSVIYDNKTRMKERIWRLDSGLAYGQEPKSKTRHLITNIEITDRLGEEITVSSNFMLVELRKSIQTIYAGRFEHHLVREDESLKIRLKKIELINNEGFLGNISFII